MSSVGMVHWHEGLFLQPHHLQTMARENAEGMSRERRLSWPYAYGVVDLRYSTDALENMLVRFDRLRAIMPSGLEVDVPGNCDLPALDIKRVFQGSSDSFTVSLAVPLWQLSRANTVEPGSTGAGNAATRRAVAEDARIKRLFRVSEMSRSDENTGENPQPVLVRRLNARLVTDGDDVSDMEVLPLIRVEPVAAEQTLPRVDRTFVPPCLTISGSAVLRESVRDISSAVEAARKDLVNQLTKGGWAVENLKGQMILDLMRLRTLNKWAARLPSLVNAGTGGAGAMPTFAAYLELRELLGDLAALTPDRDPFEGPKYDHDLPAIVFSELNRKIRPLLLSKVVGKMRSVPFTPEGPVLVAAFADADFTEPVDYLLGIRTKMAPSALAPLVQDPERFKLMEKSKAKSVQGGAFLPGITLQEERSPPIGFPTPNDLHYFRVQFASGTGSKMRWEKSKEEKAMGVRWAETETFQYDEVRMWMLLP